jgi:hypothetical protein
MTDPSLPPPTAPQPARPVSKWSIVSLVLLAPAIAFAFLPFYFVQNASTAGPAEGAALTVLVSGSCIVACMCVLVGFLTGWLGARRSRRDITMAWSGMALHGAILVLLAVAVVLGCVFAAFAEFISVSSGGEGIC